MSKILLFLIFWMLQVQAYEKSLSSFFDDRLSPSKNIIVRPEYIIIHATANCSWLETEMAFSNFLRPVSAHYVIDVDGKIIHMVPDFKRAWHAGESCWKGNEEMNAHSIGIEIINPIHSKPDVAPCTKHTKLWNLETGITISGSPLRWYTFTDKQMQSVMLLCQDLCIRHRIDKQNVLGHSDIAPGRKVDPGPLFPWKMLATKGIGLWPRQSGEVPNQFFEIRDLQKLLAKIGYKIDVTGQLDEQTKKVVQAFQMHFQQDQISGIPDDLTYKLIKNLVLQ